MGGRALDTKQLTVRWNCGRGDDLPANTLGVFPAVDLLEAKPLRGVEFAVLSPESKPALGNLTNASPVGGHWLENLVE
jgi:hypothetical protein